MRWLVVVLVVALTACARVPDPVCGESAPETALPAPQPPDSSIIPADTVAVPPGVRLVLNIPAYEVRVFRGDSLLGAYRVAVGSTRHPTRVGSFTISSITWNPWWRPPPSDWARDEKITPPGPRNPMGKVKLSYGNAYYLHGTPDSTRLERAVSHGCVRMQNTDAIDLALRLQEVLGLEIPAAEADVLMDEWQKEHTIMLQPGVPLEIRYDVVEIRDSTVFTYRDIYKREELSRFDSVLGAIESVGIARTVIDSAALAAFVIEAHGAGQIHLRDLQVGNFDTPVR